MIQRIELTDAFIGDNYEIQDEIATFNVPRISDKNEEFEISNLSGTKIYRNDEYFIILITDTEIFANLEYDKNTSIYTYNSSTTNEHTFRLYQKENKMQLFYIPTIRGLELTYTNLWLRLLDLNKNRSNRYSSYEDDKFAYTIKWEENEENINKPVLSISAYDKEHFFNQILEINIRKNKEEFNVKEILYIVQSINIY